MGADPSSSENDKKRKIEDPGDPNEVFYVEESTRPIPNPPQPVQVPEMPSAPVMQNPYAGMPYALPDTPVNEAATEAIARATLPAVRLAAAAAWRWSTCLRSDSPT